MIQYDDDTILYDMIQYDMHACVCVDIPTAREPA